MRILIQKWPEGVDIRNNGGERPLVYLLFNKPQPEAQMAPVIRLLITEGKADATGRNDHVGIRLYATRFGGITDCY